MSFPGRSSHSERFPIFDGNDYVYWQGRIRIRLQAISVELWEIVENGYIIPHLERPMTHKYRGSIIVLSISKSVEPNEEQKEMTSGFQQGTFCKH